MLHTSTNLPATGNLPASLLREIGRVIVSFARLEDKLSNALYVLLQVHRVEGRLAVREPRAADRLDLIRELLELRNIQVGTDFKALRRALEDATNRRDQIAHGVWFRNPTTGTFYLRLTRGHWPAQTVRFGKRKRLIYPEGMPFDVDECRSILATIEAAARGVDLLGEAIDLALDTSPEKFQPLPEPLDLPAVDTAKKPRSQRRSSPASPRKRS